MLSLEQAHVHRPRYLPRLQMSSCDNMPESQNVFFPQIFSSPDHIVSMPNPFYQCIIYFTYACASAIFGCRGAWPMAAEDRLSLPQHEDGFQAGNLHIEIEY